MFEENKEPVTEVTENVEEGTTEETEVIESVETPQEPEKLYTEDDFNKKLDEVLAKKIARKEAKLRKEYDKKYGQLENVLKAGTGEDDLNTITNTFTDFYTQKGINIPKEPTYSDRDMKVLAKAEADDIISSGFDEVVEEVDRLAEIGVDNMTPREKLVFTQLAEYRKTEGNRKELAKIGVTEEVLNSEDFKEFAKDFRSDVPITKIYEKYEKLQPKPKVETIGSMKNATNSDSGVKDFYTRDEALKFTKKDFDKNPALFKAVENSMSKW